MSASIYYQTVKGIRLDIVESSSFVDTLERVLRGHEPWNIHEYQYDTLLRMSADVDSDDQKQALRTLAEEARVNGWIRVWVEDGLG